MTAPLLMTSLAMILAGLCMFLRARRQARSERIVQNLRREFGLEESRCVREGFWHKVQLQIGLNFPASWLRLFAVGLLGILLWLGVSWGVAPAAGLFGAALVLAYGLVRWRYQQRLQRMVHQLPATLEHMIRSLKSGRTLSDALVLAIARSPSPLHGALVQSGRSVELGVSPGEALESLAKHYGSEEFHILALGIKINQRYGGNASDMLGKLAALIRDQERGQRQLRAMTGETRISAIVLAVLPIALGTYIFVSNPGFLLGLWTEPSGRTLLYVAVCLQVSGCLLLWRMLRSV